MMSIVKVSSQLLLNPEKSPKNIDLEIKGSKRAYCPPLTLDSVSQVSTTRLSTLLDLWPFESGLVCIFRRVRASHIERTSRVIEPVFQRALEKIFA